MDNSLQRILSGTQEFSLLKKYSSEYEIQISDSEISNVLMHKNLVLEKNKVLNLTSINDSYKALILHSLDSLLYVKLINELGINNSKILDMGTGGGFPGIPIAICTQNHVDLIDSVGKKINACTEFISELNLDNSVNAYHSRLEEFAVKNKGHYSCVTARALASLDVLIEYGSPFLTMGGYLIFSKANPTDDEINNATKVARLCGVQYVSRETFELPDDFGHRELYIYKRIAQSKIKLPRKNGEARNKPLASL